MTQTILDAPNYPSLCQLLLMYAKDPKTRSNAHGAQYDYVVSFYRLHYSFRADGTIDALYWVGKSTIPIMTYHARKQRWKPYRSIASVMAFRVLLHVWMHEAIESTGANVSDIMMFFRRHAGILLDAEDSMGLWTRIKEHYVLTHEWTIEVSQAGNDSLVETDVFF